MLVLGCLWKIIRTALMIIGACTVIMAIVVGVFLWNFSQPTALEKEMHSVEYSEEAAQAFDEEWEDFFEKGEITELRLSEEEVSSKLMDEIGEAGLPMNVKKAWVNFLPGSARIRVAAVGGILGIDVHIAAEGYVDIIEENGKYVLEYKIDKDKLELGKAPESIKNIIRENLGDKMEGTWEPPKDCPVRLDSINVEGDTLIIEGTIITVGPGG